MTIGYKKIDLGNQWSMGCGIKFSVIQCLKFWKWRFRVFYTKHGRCFIIGNQIVVSVHNSFDEANFITGAQWVVKKCRNKFIRIHQLSS